MFSFPDLTAKCGKCGRVSTTTAIGRTCQMPQPDGSTCLGVFRLPEKPKKREKDDRILVTFAGLPIGFVESAQIHFEHEGPNPFPPPKVILSERAQQAASEAYDNCDKGPRKSMRHAVEAAAGILVADNLTAIQIGIDSAVGLLEMFGRLSDAKMLRSVADMLDEYIVAVDPNRPPSDE